MAQIIREISVDVARENTFSAIVAKQNDSNSRFLKVTLTNEGEPLEIESSSTATINALREDGAAEAFLGTVNEDGTVNVPLSNWMLALDGTVKCDITVVDANSRKLTSTMFALAVEESAYGGTDVSDDPNYDLLVELLSDVSDTKAECETATTAATTAAITANEKATLADTKAALADEKATLADEKAIAANTAAASATAAATAATTAKNNADTATAAANSAAEAANTAAASITVPLSAVNISYVNTNSGLESENVNAAIDELTEKIGGVAHITAESWEDVQNIVRLGLASKAFKVGDQLECQHSTYGKLTWDILGFDMDTPSDNSKTHSMTLQMHDCVTSLQFDATEALVYAESEIAAGTYNFSIVAQPWYAADNGKTFQFTLTKAVPVGGQIVLEMTYNQALAGKSVKTYASRTSTTIIETATISEGNAGTALGASDGSVTNLNHIQRALMGSNNYAKSAMRQWLNSDAAAGSVWTPQTIFDRPPTWATSTAGFLGGLDVDFKAVLGTVTKKTVRNTVTDGGGSDTSVEGMFLVSKSEVYGGKEVAGDDGIVYPYYKDYSDLSAAGTSVDTHRIKYRNGTAQYWWIRTPSSSDASIGRYVSPTGGFSSGSASGSYGVVPACCIV